MSKWEYGGVYKNYDMEGEINIGGGILKVHNIFDPLPDFMKKADCVFCDPPCSQANINSFYTKADRTDYQTSYDPFENRFFECIEEIKPDTLFIELFAQNAAKFSERCGDMFDDTHVYETTYYHKKDCRCYIIACSNRIDVHNLPFDGMDEEDVIAWIGKNVDYKCIGDPCMGRGLVGWHSYINGKPFVGTELNKKRLAVLVDKIAKHQKT